MKTVFQLLIATLLIIMGPAAMAQLIQENVAFDRPEAWAMKYYTAASLMQGNAPPAELKKKQFSIGFDISNIPYLSKDERTVGFNGSKEENMNKAPVLARPLLNYGVTDRLSASASYMPPVEIFTRLKTHVAALFFNYDLLEKGNFKLRLRAGGQWTEARGDFTCPAEIAGIMDPEINPYMCEEPSNDRFISRTGTINAILKYSLPVRRQVDLNLDVAYTYADLEFRVDALWAGGFADLRELYASGGMWTYGVGLDTAVTERIHANLTIIHAPLDVRRPPDYAVENDSLTYFRLSINLLL